MAALSAEAKAIYKKANEELAGNMCYTIEWCNEELPLDNPESDVLNTHVQQMMDDTRSVGIFEHFQKAKKDAALKLSEPAPANKLNVLVFADGDGFCQGILDHAPEGRVGKRKVVSDPPDSLSQEDVRQLLEPKWDLVLFGFGLDLPESNDVQDIHDQQKAVACVYFYLSKELIRDDTRAKKVAVLTRGVFTDDTDLHNATGVRIATPGVLFGMTNTLRLELSAIPFQYIDTEFSVEPARWRQQDSKLLPRLASEVFRGTTFGHNTVRLLHDGRFVLRQLKSSAYEAAKQPFNMPDHGVIAITGGNGALGLVMGNWLLGKAEEQKVGGFAIYFLSRSAKVSDDSVLVWKAIEKRAARLNITVEQRKCDVSSPEACDAFVKEHSPNLSGIIHSAGVLRDKMLMGMEWDSFETVWDAKSRAALYLHDALERYSNPDLEFFWMFSSISVYGNMGQLNYSGSNSYLDALCRYRRALGKPAIAIQWGAWGEVGMAAKLDAASKQRFADGPAPPFTTKEGLLGLEAGLRTGLPGVSCFKYNPPVMFKQVEDCDSELACYARNFTSLIIPTKGVPTLDGKHVYSIYRMILDGYHGGYSKRLQFGRYIQPEIDDALDSNWW